MSSTQDFVDYVIDQIGIKDVAYRKMFGEYALYVDGKVIGLICDNTLFIKPVPENKELATGLSMGPAYPGAKDTYIVDEDRLEDRLWLKECIEITASALPQVTKKKKS